MPDGTMLAILVLRLVAFPVARSSVSTVADEGPEQAPPNADLRTAEHLGRRVATVAKQLAAGRQFLMESTTAESRIGPTARS